MSKYVPPHVRNAPKPQERFRRRNDEYREQRRREEDEVQKKEEQSRENNEQNFPTLITRLSAPSWSVGTKTFAQLASEWSEKSKEEELLKKDEEESKNTLQQRYTHSLPKFRNVRRFVEVEDQPQSSETSEEEQIEDEWKVVVHRKPRREKTIEEKFSRPITPPQDSVWNADDHPNENETCWDERRY